MPANSRKRGSQKRTHLSLLLWKNATLQARKPVSTAFEIGLPTLFMMILAGLRAAIMINGKDFCIRPEPPEGTKNINDYYNDCQWAPFQPLNISRNLNDNFASSEKSSGSIEHRWMVGYTAPSSSMADAATIMSDACSYFTDNPDNCVLTSYTTEQSLEQHLVSNSSYYFGHIVGVVFQDLNLQEKQAKYSLRLDAVPGGYVAGLLGQQHNQGTWLTRLSFPIFTLTSGPRNPLSKPVFSDDLLLDGSGRYGADPFYQQYGFLPMQYAVNLAIGKAFNDGNDIPLLQSLLLNRFPFPQWKDDSFSLVIRAVLPLFLTLTLLFTALSITKNIVSEKESKIRETLKMMGVAAWMQWFAWFVQYLFFLSFSVIIITGLAKIGSVLDHSDWSLFFIFMVLFAVASINFMFLVSVFFDKASTAAAVAGVIWFASYMPYRFLTPRWATLTVADKTGACLISTTCMCIGANVIGQFEGSGEGITWENMNNPVSADDPFTFSRVLLMLIVDSVLYALLTLYLDAIFPGAHGVPKPWYFFLPQSIQSLFTKRGPRRGEYSLQELSINSDDDMLVLDDDISDLTAGVELESLRKVFKSRQGNVVAVKGTTLKMYEGQVTALLGHNGAGKTTTMSILCGLLPPSSGTAKIHGHDISTELHQAQSSLGFCPQHNTLFESLTVAEHLWFFCKLKLVPDNLVYRYIDEMIADLQLLDKRHTRATSLSGGMKRKLSCGMALVGGSPVVILDEPTSGCDPSARRAIWDLLIKHKPGRTMLLSTHFMDEADVLGDRIAIMVEGSVKCAGTSLSLKSHYGIGYNLSVVKHRQVCTAENLLQAVSPFVPNVELKRDTIAEVALALPRESSSKFSELFAHLDEKKDSLGIQSYGMSATTIEEVFLKVGEEANSSHRTRPTEDEDDEEDTAIDGNMQDIDAPLDSQPATSFALKKQQFFALINKRWLHTKRNRWAVLTQLLVPGFFVLLALIVAKTYPSTNESIARNMNNLGSNYGPTNVLFAPEQRENRTQAQKNLQESVSNALKSQCDAVGATVDNMDLSKASQMSNKLITAAGKDTREIAVFNRHTMIAFSDNTSIPDDDSIRLTAWFNGQGYHTISEALSLATNVILSTTNANAQIITENKPLPRTEEELVDASGTDTLGFSVAIVLMFGMSFLGASFIMFIVSERASKAKHMQFLGGIDVFTFWASSFLFDVLNYLLPTFVLLILFATFGVEAFTTTLSTVLTLLLCYGFAMIPMAYLMSFFFLSAPLAYSRMVLFNVVTGLAAIYTIFILQQTDPDVVDVMKAVFIVLPNYCFGQGFVDLYTNYQYHENQEIICLSKKLEPNIGLPCPAPGYLSMESPGLGRYVLSLLLQGVVYLALVLAIDLNFHRVVSRYLRVISRALIDFCIEDDPRQYQTVEEDQGEASAGTRNEDEDVSAERSRIEDENTGEDIVVLKEISKDYAGAWCGTSFTAVNSLSVGVGPGSCFGLLGVNGAGKTTTFKMLTGDESVTSGTALLDGYDIKKDLASARRRVGYAPQFDALIDLMTGREHLHFFANLRGIPKSKITSRVNKLLAALGLNKYADKYSKTYSGGNKRKLSTAIALIGSPPVVLLDEPTSGMDPLARRFLWDVLQKALQEGKCIILTSHSMEECESLCSKIGIMVNGRFKCLGSTQHLKNRFGKGFKVMTKVNSLDTITELESFLKEKLPSITLTEQHALVSEWTVTENMALASLFRIIEEAKSKYDLADYSVSQTTLEQVFIDFARAQEEVSERENMYREVGINISR